MLSARATSHAVVRSARRSGLVALVAILLAAALCIWMIDALIEREMRSQIAGDLSMMQHVAVEGGTIELAVLINALDGGRAGNEQRAALFDPDGRRIAGTLAGAFPEPGWSRVGADGGGADTLALTAILTDGSHLTVGRAMRVRTVVNRVLLVTLPLTALFQIGCAFLLGLQATRVLGRQLDDVDRAMERFSEGDLSARAAREAQGGDRIDELAANVNAALDRIQVLIGTVQRTASAIAHDLRKPLTRVSFSIEQARRSALPEEAEAHLRGAEAEIDKLAEASRAILHLAEIESQSGRKGFAPFDLAALVRELAETYEPLLEDGGGSLRLDAPAGPVPATGDRALLGQAVVNLVENVLRHCPAPVAVTLGLEAEGGEARIRVADDGPGVPEAEREAVFEAFHRIDRSRTTDGTGLGLATVRAVAERHGGRVRAEDAAPGLRVVLTLPILEGRAQRRIGTLR